MKRFIFLSLILGLFTCSQVQAQFLSEKEIKKEAKKTAKDLEKQGWLTAPGNLSLEAQQLKATKMANMVDEDFMPKFIMGDGKSVGDTYDAAKAQAIEVAKRVIASKLGSTIIGKAKIDLGNSQHSTESATSKTELTSATEITIAQRLGNVISVVECYRPQPNKHVEVLVYVAYNYKKAHEIAEESIKQNLSQKIDNLHDELKNITVE